MDKWPKRRRQDAGADKATRRAGAQSCASGLSDVGQAVQREATQRRNVEITETGSTKYHQSYLRVVYWCGAGLTQLDTIKQDWCCLRT